MRNDLIQSNTNLQVQITQLQETQHKILTLLEGLYNVNSFQAIVPEMRSISNKLNAISKVYSSGIG